MASHCGERIKFGLGIKLNSAFRSDKEHDYRFQSFSPPSLHNNDEVFFGLGIKLNSAFHSSFSPPSLYDNDEVNFSAQN